MDAKHSLLSVFDTVNHTVAPLSTFQRILLMTDGTVTDVLEAYALEPIRVVKLSQSFDAIDGERPELERPTSDRVLRRSILLQGAHSGTNFVYADSGLTPDHLHSEVLEGLLLGETAPRSAERSAIEQPALVVGHPNDPLHPFSDADMLTRELRDVRKVDANSILEWRLWPQRLNRELAAFLDEVWSSADAQRRDERKARMAGGGS